MTHFSLFYKKFIGLLTKKGERKKALKIINNALLNTSKLLTLPVRKIITELYNKLSSSVEIKKIKIRRSVHFVPFPVNLKRKLFLIIKWFVFAISNNELNKNLEYKLREEFLKIVRKQESLVYQHKKYQIQKSFKYQTNTHFRW